jgi:hypothetical protein
MIHDGHDEHRLGVHLGVCGVVADQLDEVVAQHHLGPA